MSHALPLLELSISRQPHSGESGGKCLEPGWIIKPWDLFHGGEPVESPPIKGG